MKTARKPKTAVPFKPPSSIPTLNLERVLRRTACVPAYLTAEPLFSAQAWMGCHNVGEGGLARPQVSFWTPEPLQTASALHWDLA